MTETTPSSMALAEEMIGLEFGSLSPSDIRQLQDIVLDYCSVTLCGSVQLWGRKLDRWAAAHGAGGAATIIGSGRKAGAAAASLVNGTSTHGFELDDTHEPGHCHPGGPVISAALAVAEEEGACGSDLLAAIAAGYEAMARVAMACGGTKGIHPTSGFGPFGAATAAAKLKGFDAEGLARAWGLALSMAGGAVQFAHEPAGTMVKRMHGGIPSQNGVLASELSALQVSAPVRTFEGESGFFKTFGRNPESAKLARAKDAPLEIHRISFKPYSCCRLFHAVIDALEEVTDGFSLPIEKMTSIEAYVPQSAIAKHMMRRVDSIMAAQYSLPYIVAATLACGPRHYEAFGTAYHNDRALLDIIDKVEGLADDTLLEEAPESMPGRVAVRLDDGSVREAKVLEALGSPAKPLGREGIEAKARAIFAMVGSSVDVERLTSTVDALPTAANLSELMNLLSIEDYDAAGVGD